MSSSLTVLRCTLIMQLSPLHCLYLVKLIVIPFIYKQQYRCDVVFTNAASRGHLYHMWRESADSSLHSGTSAMEERRYTGRNVSRAHVSAYSGGKTGEKE